MLIAGLLYKNFLWRGLFYLSALVLNIAIARSLGPETSGELYFFLNNLYVAILVLSFSLEAGITFFVSKGGTAENNLATFALAWSILSSALIALAFYLLYPAGSSVLDSSLVMLGCLGFSIGSFLNTYFSAFFYSHDDYRTPNLIALTGNIILILFLPWTGNWMGERAFFILFFMVNLLQGLAVALAWILSRKLRLGLNATGIRNLSPVFRYSFSALIGNLIFFLLYRMDYWFVDYYCDDKSLGNYIQVSRLGQLLILPSVMMAGTLFPQASKENFSFESKIFMRIFGLALAAYVLLFLLLLFFGRSIILLAWGEAFAEMHVPLLLIMPGLLFLAISYLFSPIFAGKGSVNQNVFIAALVMVVVFICNMLLVPEWGINGAAASTSIGFMVMMILYFIIAKLKFGFNITNVFRAGNEQR